MRIFGMLRVTNDRKPSSKWLILEHAQGHVSLRPGLQLHFSAALLAWLPSRGRLCLWPGVPGGSRPLGRVSPAEREEEESSRETSKQKS